MSRSANTIHGGKYNGCSRCGAQQSVPALQHQFMGGQSDCGVGKPRRSMFTHATVASQMGVSQRPAPGNLTMADRGTQRLQRSDWREQRADWAVLAPPSRNMNLPAPLEGKAVILVEGRRDATAVLRSVNAPVFFMGGTNSRKNPVAVQKLQAVASAVPAIIVLADPDAEGERFRGFIAREFGSKFMHSFLPVSRAVAGDATDNHEAGNVGIEHAREADIATALRMARPYDLHGSEFCGEDLESWELVNAWDQCTVKHAALRREIVCNALGLARMDGKKLIKALNHYSFPRNNVRLHHQIVFAFRNDRVMMHVPSICHALLIACRCNAALTYSNSCTAADQVQLLGCRWRGWCNLQIRGFLMLPGCGMP